jgi:hypothetical protein
LLQGYACGGASIGFEDCVWGTDGRAQQCHRTDRFLEEGRDHVGFGRKVRGTSMCAKAMARAHRSQRINSISGWLESQPLLLIDMAVRTAWVKLGANFKKQTWPVRW